MILKNATIYLENEVINNGYIIVENGRIKEVGTGAIEGGIDLKGKSILPGFIDQHIHGANKYDFMDGSVEAVKSICEYLPQEGVTSVVATTITQTKDKILKGLQTINEHMRNQGERETRLVGVHLEGPFINLRNKGAQNPDFIMGGTVDLFKEYMDASNHSIKLVTYAPELDQNYLLTKYMLENDVMPSIGHSSASFKTVTDVVGLGVKNLTHFYNGMIPFSHREPGIVNAGLYYDELLCELIVDGIHVDSDVIKATFKIKGRENIILISDAMRAKGLGDGEYDLGGQKVTVKGRKATLDSGTIAGSVLSFNDSIKNMMKFTNATLEDIMYMSSINSAKQLNMFDQIGSIAQGKIADLVVLDQDYNVDMTIINGNIVFEK